MKAKVDDKYDEDAYCWFEKKDNNKINEIYCKIYLSINDGYYDIKITDGGLAILGDSILVFKYEGLYTFTLTFPGNIDILPCTSQQ